MYPWDWTPSSSETPQAPLESSQAQPESSQTRPEFSPTFSPARPVPRDSVRGSVPENKTTDRPTLYSHGSGTTLSLSDNSLYEYGRVRHPPVERSAQATSPQSEPAVFDFDDEDLLQTVPRDQLPSASIDEYTHPISPAHILHTGTNSGSVAPDAVGEARPILPAPPSSSSYASEASEMEQGPDNPLPPHNSHAGATARSESNSMVQYGGESWDTLAPKVKKFLRSLANEQWHVSKRHVKNIRPLAGSHESRHVAFSVETYKSKAK